MTDITRRTFLVGVGAAIAGAALCAIVKPDAPRTIDEIPGDELEFIIDDAVMSAFFRLRGVVTFDHARALVNVVIDTDRLWRDAVRLGDGNGNLWRTYDQGETWVRA